MKIAIHQSAICFEDKKVNLSNAREVIQTASQEKANIIVFPEMSFTGFSMNVAHIGENEDETMQMMKELAEQFHISIGFGWVKLVESEKSVKGENHYSIVSPKKELIFDYVKCHPFSYAHENLYYVPGRQVSFCQIDNFTVSVAICYDLRFPELFQIESKTAQLILVPANWPESRSHHWRTLLEARAIENQCYIVGINCRGIMDEQTYSGDSCIINPNGEVLFHMSIQDELGIYEITNNVASYQTSFPMKQDRREAFYQSLIMND